MPDGITTTPGSTFYPRLEWPTSGLVGTLGVRILKDSDGSTSLARSTAGITETPAGSGQYVATLVAPTIAGEYTVFWDDGTIAPGHVASEDLQITYTAASTSTPGGTDLCTVAQVKEMLESSSSATDSLVQNMITRASFEIERRYQRYFTDHGTSTKIYRVDGNIIDLAPREVRSVSSLTLRDPEQSMSLAMSSPSDYQLRPVGGWDDMGTYTQIALNLNIAVGGFAINWDSAEMVVAASWGPTVIPYDVTDACIKTVVSWLDRAFNSYAWQQMNSEGNVDVRPDKFSGYSIPASAHRILQVYDRNFATMVT